MDTVFIRFLVGGLVVSLFSALGDVLRPKSFAGLFGAAPSIALATIGLTIRQNGSAYAALECRAPYSLIERKRNTDPASFSFFAYAHRTMLRSVARRKCG